jgi:hypothetical protein
VNEILTDLARTVNASSLHATALNLLSNVPGAPPIIQTVHLLSIAAIMGSIVMIDLKLLGLILPSQATTELTRRLMPWTWGALPLLALSGLVFVFARPGRYLLNPVFGIKFALLAPAVTLAAYFHWMSTREEGYWEKTSGRRTTIRIVAAVSLLLWLGVAMMGRWIAYADYLFPPE